MNTKKRLITALIAGLLAALGVLSGCNGSPHGVQGTNGAGPNAQNNESGIVSFEFYDYNAFLPGALSYCVSVESDGSATLSYTSQDHFDYGTLTCGFDSADLEALEALYANFRIAEWNGFDKTNYDVLDGGGFSLSMAFKDGETLSAHGSNAYPERFGDVSSAVKELFAPYEKTLLEQARQAKIDAGLTGTLDSFHLTIIQHGTSGKDEYHITVTKPDDSGALFDVNVSSVSGEFWPEGDYRYNAIVPDEMDIFSKYQALVEKYDIIEWMNWNVAAEDYNNAEWFQLDLSYDSDDYLDAYGTEHPANYAEFRQEVLQLTYEIASALA